MKPTKLHRIFQSLLAPEVGFDRIKASDELCKESVAESKDPLWILLVFSGKQPYNCNKNETTEGLFEKESQPNVKTSQPKISRQVLRQGAFLN